MHVLLLSSVFEDETAQSTPMLSGGESILSNVSIPLLFSRIFYDIGGITLSA
jgi:hypothetical protein